MDKHLNAFKYYLNLTSFILFCNDILGVLDKAFESNNSIMTILCLIKSNDENGFFLKQF